MHCVIIKVHFDALWARRLWDNGRLSPCACTSNICVYACKGGMVSEDHVMLLLLLGSYIGCIVRKRSSLDASCGRGEREKELQVLF